LISAFVLINCEFPFSTDVIDELKKISEIIEIYRVENIYDIIAKVNVDTEEELNEIVMTHIRGIEEVKNTLTMVIAQGKRDRRQSNAT
jgi:DNA-binding Lrp family transcriptional regulator